MNSPFTGGIATLHKEPAERQFRGAWFALREHFYVCQDTGRAFSTTALDALNRRQVLNAYRAAHGLPFPDALRYLRIRCGMDAAQMAQMLGLAGDYDAYEDDRALPGTADAGRIRRALHDLEAARPDSTLRDMVWNLHAEANAFTGYITPHFEKVAHFVLFFAERLQPLKTRLNKLLFYADFTHFHELGIAISGVNYRAIRLGPVPSHYHELFGFLESLGYLRIEEEIGERGTGERFLPVRRFDPSWFTLDELLCMEGVAAQLGRYSTADIVELSHREAGWRENVEQRELIDFQRYGFDLAALPVHLPPTMMMPHP